MNRKAIRESNHHLQKNPIPLSQESQRVEEIILLYNKLDEGQKKEFRQLFRKLSRKYGFIWKEDKLSDYLTQLSSQDYDELFVSTRLLLVID